MRLLLINPNTTAAITDRMLAVAAPLLPPGVDLRGATGRFGAAYIASRAAAAIAGHATLDAFAEHGEGCDAVLLACFGDPGLAALRELSPVPVVGLAEASGHAACQFGRRFGVVTGGSRWGPMLEEFYAGIGLASRLAGIRTVAPTGAEIAANPRAALAALAQACRGSVEQDGAEVVVLAGAGLAGLAAAIADQVPVPLLCSVETGIRAVLAAAAARPAKARAGSHAPADPVPSIGLSPALAARLGETSTV